MSSQEDDEKRLLVELAIFEYFVHQNIAPRLLPAAPIDKLHDAYSYAVLIDYMLELFKTTFGAQLPFDDQLSLRLDFAKIVNIIWFPIARECLEATSLPEALGRDRPCCHDHQIKGLHLAIGLIERRIEKFGGPAAYPILSQLRIYLALKTTISIDNLSTTILLYFPETHSPYISDAEYVTLLDDTRANLMNCLHHPCTLDELRANFKVDSILCNFRAFLASLYQAMDPPLIFKTILSISKEQAMSISEEIPLYPNAQADKGFRPPSPMIGLFTQAMAESLDQVYTMNELRPLQPLVFETSPIRSPSKHTVSQSTATTISPKPDRNAHPSIPLPLPAASSRPLPIEIADKSPINNKPSGRQFQEQFAKWCVEKAKISKEIDDALKQKCTKFSKRWKSFLTSAGSSPTIATNNPILESAENNLDTAPPNPIVDHHNCSDGRHKPVLKRSLLDRHDSAEKISDFSDSDFKIVDSKTFRQKTVDGKAISTIKTPTKPQVSNHDGATDQTPANIVVANYDSATGDSVDMAHKIIRIKGRQRRPWTNEEEKTLADGIQKYGRRWALILSTFKFNNRTQVDLKDKARIMEKSGKYKDLFEKRP